MQRFGDPLLCELTRLAQIAERHFLLDQLNCSRLDLALLIEREAARAVSERTKSAGIQGALRLPAVQRWSARA